MLHNLKLLYIYFRNIYKYQTKKIILVEKNNKIIKSTFIYSVVQLLSILNLNFVINKFGYNYLFFIDDMYYYNTNNKPKTKIIFSIITNCFIKYNSFNYDITEKILKYNLEVPMFIIFENENIFFLTSKNDIIIEFNLFNLNQNKRYSIEEIKYKKLGEII
jgi:hypothetical protein